MRPGCRKPSHFIRNRWGAVVDEHCDEFRIFGRAADEADAPGKPELLNLRTGTLRLTAVEE